MKSKGLLNMISSLLSNDNSKNYQNATNSALRFMKQQLMNMASIIK